MSDLLASPVRLNEVILGEVGVRRVALSLADARGVTVPGKVTPIPGSPPSLAGLIYFRGGIEAVVNLPAVWGDKPAQVTSASRAILIESEGMRCVLILDSLLNIIDLNPDQLREPEAGLPGVVSVFESEGSLIHLISGSDLLRYVEAYVSLNNKR